MTDDRTKDSIRKDYLRDAKADGWTPNAGAQIKNGSGPVVKRPSR